jgi:hypothetical protein
MKDEWEKGMIWLIKVWAVTAIIAAGGLIILFKF